MVTGCDVSHTQLKAGDAVLEMNGCSALAWSHHTLVQKLLDTMGTVELTVCSANLLFAAVVDAQSVLTEV